MERFGTETRNSTLLSMNTTLACQKYQKHLKKQYDFIRKINNITDEVWNHILWRYEEIWLPIVASNRDQKLYVPDDIRLVWDLHMYKHTGYAAYCTKRFGMVLKDSSFCSGHEDTIHDWTKALWKAKNKDTPFFLDLSKPILTSPARTEKLKINDFKEELTKLKAFAQIVLYPHFQDPRYISDSKTRYIQFIEMTVANPDMVFIPTIDIEYIWRVHLLHPVIYRQDLNAIVFTTLDLYALPSDIEEFERHVSHTKLSWYSLYQHNYILPSCGFSYLLVGKKDNDIQPMPETFNKNADMCQKCDIQITDITVSNIWSKDKKIILEARRLGDNSFTYTSLFKSKGKAGRMIKGEHSKPLFSTSFDDKYHRGIEFHVYGIKGSGCFKKETHVARLLFDPRKSFTNSGYHNKSWTVEVPRVSVTDPTIVFECSIKSSASAPISINLYREPFVHESLPQELLKETEAISLWSQVDSEDPEGCLIARHKLADKQIEELSCEIVRGQGCSVAGILLQHPVQGLLCVAYSIGQGNMPSPDQVTEDCSLSIDTFLGDQGMLIKNHQGVWGICVAKVESTGDDDEITVEFYHIENETTEQFKMSMNGQGHVRCREATVDMKTGKVTLDVGCQEIAENITLGFSIGILCILSQRRMNLLYSSRASLKTLTDEQLFPDLDQSQSDGYKHSLSRFTAKRRHNKENRKTLKQLKRRRSSLYCTYLMACGLQADVWEGIPGMHSGKSSVRSVRSNAKLIMSDDSTSGSFISKEGSNHFYELPKESPMQESKNPVADIIDIRL